MKLDLTYLRRLVQELNTLVDAALAQEDDKTAHHEYLVELNKATGVLVGISNESKMLIGDIAQLVRVGTAQKPETSLQDILGGNKDPFDGNYN